MIGKETEIFKKYLPEKSVSYCHRLWKENHIQFTISKPRKTLYGNYMFKGGVHYISVNGDLNPEAFLVTYLHEVAHLLVRVHYKNRMKPHGREWQHQFRELMKPMIHDAVFEPEVSRALWNHISSPTATSCADPVLHQLLHTHHDDDNETVAVNDCRPGTYFIFNARMFRMLRKIRTRYECMDLESGNLYRFQPSARVRMMDYEPEDPTDHSATRLHHLLPGERFVFNHKRFEMKEMRRTRFVCKEVATGKLFLINQMVMVEKGE